MCDCNFSTTFLILRIIRQDILSYIYIGCRVFAIPDSLMKLEFSRQIFLKTLKCKIS
jgi:hypothetical protein